MLGTRRVDTSKYVSKIYQLSFSSTQICKCVCETISSILC